MNWSNLFVMLITFVFINNVVLNQFLGMCPFMGVSKKSSSAIGMGAAVTFVIVAASLVTYGLYYMVLDPLNLQYMDPVSYTHLDVYKRQPTSSDTSGSSIYTVLFFSSICTCFHPLCFAAACNSFVVGMLLS